MKMEEIKVNIKDVEYLIIPLDIEAFDVRIGSIKISTLVPYTLDIASTHWISEDDVLPERLTKELGEAVENYYL